MIVLDTSGRKNLFELSLPSQFVPRKTRLQRYGSPTPARGDDVLRGGPKRSGSAGLPHLSAIIPDHYASGNDPFWLVQGMKWLSSYRAGYFNRWISQNWRRYLAQYFPSANLLGNQEMCLRVSFQARRAPRARTATRVRAFPD